MSNARGDPSSADNGRRADWLRNLAGLPPAGYQPQQPHSEVDDSAGSIDIKINRQAHMLNIISRKMQSPATPVEQQTMGEKVLGECKAFFLSKLNVLMVAAPLAIVSYYAHWGDGPTFVFCMVGLVPLAERLGFVTEQLAMYTNDTLGGLLNATFGNATEVIISVFALRRGLLRVVQLSLLGSIVSNLLLVLGSAFIAGGVAHPMQRFNQQGINVNCGLLILAVVAIVLPSLLSETQPLPRKNTDDDDELALSRFMSIFLLICYGLYLVFQLYTHRFLYEEHADDAPRPLANDNHSGSGAPSRLASTSKPGEVEMANGTSSRAGAASADAPTTPARYTAAPSSPPSPLEPHSSNDHGATMASQLEAGRLYAGPAADEEHGEEEEEEKELSFVGCFVWLALVTVAIAWLSEILVEAIEGASDALHIPLPFLTTILLPIVGNAAEHSSAVIFAYKNRMEISLGVAVGSSCQVGVLIVPLCVVLAWTMGQPLTLNFNSFEAVTLFISVLLAIILLQDGYSNWLKGAMLVATYVFVAAGFWCHEDPLLQQQNVDAQLADASHRGFFL